jgi:hypothetical protein
VVFVPTGSGAGSRTAHGGFSDGFLEPDASLQGMAVVGAAIGLDQPGVLQSPQHQYRGGDRQRDPDHQSRARSPFRG